METVPFRPQELKSLYARRLRQADDNVKMVVRVYPPRDTGGDVEVLFLTWKNEPLTAYFSDGSDAEPVIASGW